MACIVSLGLAGTASAVGALAIDSNQGARYGSAYGFSSMTAAENAALAKCGQGCRIVVRFTRGCGAYAADQSPGSTFYGYALASDAATVKRRALGFCAQGGARRCVVRVWGCNS